ncbi:hypothetical protein H8D04_00445 [bacterium]|nr:hypothetical protein [bacterium]
MKKIINCNKEHNPVINKKLKKVSVEEGLKIKSITPIFCDECGRLLEYKVELYNKKTW